MKYILVMSTCKDEKEADTISEALLSKRLAACVQMHPVNSAYIWEEKVCKDNEIRMLIKAPFDKLQMITEEIKSLHSYETPQILHLDINGEEQYLAWMDSVCARVK